MKHILLSAASLVILTATPALAQSYDDDSGWYIRGNAGYGTHLDGEFDANGIFDGDIESEGNFGGTVGVGYEFGNDSKLDNWRLELDGDTLFTDFGAIDQQPFTSAKLRTNSLMVNAIYAFEDFDGLGGLNKFRPYIGAGLGLINADLDATSAAFTNGDFLVNNPVCLDIQLGTCDVRDSDTSFGWQGLAGIDVEVAKNLFWDTHYTYRKVGNSDLDFTGTFTPLQASRVGPLEHLVELSGIGSHSIMTGLRYKFGGSTPPPPTSITCSKGCWHITARDLRPGSTPIPTVPWPACGRPNGFRGGSPQ